AFEFFIGEAFVGGSGDLVAADREDFVGFGVPAAGVDAEDAGVGVLGGVAVDVVGEAAFLADLLEEAGRHAAAERGVEHAEREAAFVGAGHSGAAEDDVGLLGVLLDHHGARVDGGGFAVHPGRGGGGVPGEASFEGAGHEADGLGVVAAARGRTPAAWRGGV